MFELLVRLLTGLFPIILKQKTKKDYIFQIIWELFIFTIIVVIITFLSFYFKKAPFYYIFMFIAIIIFILPNFINYFMTKEKTIKKYSLIFILFIIFFTTIYFLIFNIIKQKY